MLINIIFFNLYVSLFLKDIHYKISHFFFLLQRYSGGVTFFSDILLNYLFFLRVSLIQLKLNIDTSLVKQKVPTAPATTFYITVIKS